jgi:hypothetical protein
VAFTFPIALKLFVVGDKFKPGTDISVTFSYISNK